MLVIDRDYFSFLFIGNSSDCFYVGRITVIMATSHQQEQSDKVRIKNIDCSTQSADYCDRSLSNGKKNRLTKLYDVIVYRDGAPTYEMDTAKVAEYIAGELKSHNATVNVECLQTVNKVPFVHKFSDWSSARALKKKVSQIFCHLVKVFKLPQYYITNSAKKCLNLTLYFRLFV